MRFDYARFSKLGGSRLRAHRKLKGYTLEQLSKLTGISVNTLCSYEKGYSLPNFLHLVCLCRNLCTVPQCVYFEFFDILY